MKKHISTKIITVILALAVMITSVLPLSAIADEISEPVNEAVVTADDLQEPEDIISEDNLYSEEILPAEMIPEEDADQEKDTQEEKFAEDADAEGTDAKEADAEEAGEDEETNEVIPDQEEISDEEEIVNILSGDEDSDVPVISKVTPSASDITVEWDAIAGALGYRVYKRASEDEEWTLLTDTTEISCTDTDVASGTGYYYAVESYKLDESSNEVVSEKSEAVFCVYLEAPKPLTVQTGANGMIVTWAGSEGADSYKLLRKAESDTEWTEITDTDALTYTDNTDLVSGTKYFYTVKALKTVDETTYESIYNEPGLTTVYLATPHLLKISNTTKGISFSWEAVDGATEYRVYRKNPKLKTPYVAIDTVSTTSYVDVIGETPESAEANTLYYYTVRAIAKDGEVLYAGYFEVPALNGYWMKTPNVKKVENIVGGLKVFWEPVSGADGYYIYRKADGDVSWKKVKVISGGSKNVGIDTTAVGGKTYTYTVRALKKITSTKVVTSSNLKGITVTRLAAPGSIKVTNVSTGYKVTWGAVTAATKYVVFRRRDTTKKWTSVGTVTGTSYIDKTAVKDYSYYYTVVAYNSTGRSPYNKTGILSPNTAKGLMISKAQSYSSNTDWLILINCTSNRFGVFQGSKGNWELVKYWQCTTGKEGHETCKGVYTINYKGYSFDGEHMDYTCYYFCSFNGAYMMHSTLFKYHTFNDMDARLGMDLSQGCVRLYINNAKWVYENMPIGTTVVTYATTN